MTRHHACRRGVSLPNYFYGGGQEGGRRAGTENVMQVVGLGAAAALVSAEGPRLRAHMGAMAQRLLAGVRAAVRPEEQVGGAARGGEGPLGYGRNSAKSQRAWAQPLVSGMSLTLAGLTPLHGPCVLVSRPCGICDRLQEWDAVMQLPLLHKSHTTSHRCLHRCQHGVARNGMYRYVTVCVLYSSCRVPAAGKSAGERPRRPCPAAPQHAEPQPPGPQLVASAAAPVQPAGGLGGGGVPLGRRAHRVQRAQGHAGASREQQLRT